MGKLIRVNEYFLSVEGEGTRQGLPTFFVRLSGCQIQCNDCDTKYAWDKDSGELLPIEDIAKIVKSVEAATKNPQTLTVSITGGNPMESFRLPYLADVLIRSGVYLHLEHSGIFVGEFREELEICKQFDSICFDIKSRSAVGDRFDVLGDLIKIRGFVEDYLGTVQFRCVFKTREDLDHYKELLGTVILDKYPVYFSPCFKNGSIDKGVLEGGLIKEVVGDITMGRYGRGARIGIQLHKVLSLR